MPPGRKGTKIVEYLNSRLTVTLADGRVMVGTFLAFDKFMNVVLSDAIETRRVSNPKDGQNELSRELGLVLLRGEHVVSIKTEKKEEAVPKGVPPGPGTAKVAGRGAPLLPGA